MSDNPCSVEAFPFSYFDANGSLVDGALNEAGVCIFETANCHPDAPTTSCCQPNLTSFPKLTTTGSNYMFIAFAIIFIPIVYIKHIAPSKERKQEKADEKERMVPWWIKAFPISFLRKIMLRLFHFGLMAYIATQVVIPIFMRQSIQAELTVSSRNSLIAAEAFLVPYAEIFQFIEDIVLVRVNYALGRKDKALTSQLVHVGISGSLMTGILAAVIATILSVIPPVLQALTSPGLDNDRNLYASCEFVEATDAGEVLPYWLLESWALPGSQIGMVMSGFLFGAIEINVLGWLGALAQGLLPLIWFLNVSKVSTDQNGNTLLLLASGDFATAWAFPVLSILYLSTPLGREIRERTGVTLSLRKLVGSMGDPCLKSMAEPQAAAEADVANASTNNDSLQEHAEVGQNYDTMAKVDSTDLQVANNEGTSKNLLMEGFKIMFMDVTIQATLSLSIYLALLKDGAVGYQLTALQSALPTYGIAYALGMGIVMKIIGPQLIANGKYQLFVNYAVITLICAVLLVPLIVGAVIPFTREMMFDYGTNACEYANGDQCVPFFTTVLGPNAAGGEFSLEFTFERAFAYGASIEAVFFVTRATMLACLDLDYMMYCTIASVICYIPAICVAVLVPQFGGTAAAFFFAMYVPQIILIILFLIRLQNNLRRMLRGEEGTWTKEETTVAKQQRTEKTRKDVDEDGDVEVMVE